MTEVHQFKSALDTFEYTNGVYNYTIAPGVWTYIDVDELNFEHLVDIVSKTHGIKIYVANQENFFKKFEIEIGANLGASAGSATTDALPEGSTNLYFTNGRAVSALTASLLSNLTPTVNPQSGTSYTVGTVGTDSDGKTILRMDSAADNTATITTAQTMPISIRQAGLGTTTIGAGAGVTLNGAATFTSQHQTKTVYRVSAGIYDIVG
jgi:hypothetical protein